MINITSKQDFEKEVLHYDGIAVVDFFALWCNPCKMISPILEEISEEYKNIKVCKVNIDENEYLVNEYNIVSVPSIFIFKNGEIKHKMFGFHDKDEILEKINI